MYCEINKKRASKFANRYFKMETDSNMNLRPLTKRFSFELIDDEERVNLSSFA